ncbi:MAG TPA: sulfotransferase [Acidimicrobiia bacterium]|jgi:hypothetical protein
MSSVRVVLVVGTGRSGSTVLANVLGEAQGLFSAGEVRFLWERGLLENRLCGCGVRLQSCRLWRDVLALAFGDREMDARRLVDLQKAETRLRRLPQSLAVRGRPPGGETAELVSALGRVYAAMASVTNARVIVDSSKLPAYGFLLERVPGIDLRLLHLVRDPRAAAFSWSRRKVQPDRGSFGYMEQLSPAKSAALWSVWNAAAEARWGRDPERYRRVRYEDFVAHPMATVAGILEWLGEPGAGSAFTDSNVVELGENHSVAGNPNRLHRGQVRLRLDSEWLSHMPTRDRLAVTAGSWPLLLRYGYTLAAVTPAAAPPALSL